MAAHKLVISGRYYGVSASTSSDYDELENILPAGRRDLVYAAAQRRNRYAGHGAISSHSDFYLRLTFCLLSFYAPHFYD